MELTRERGARLTRGGTCGLLTTLGRTMGFSFAAGINLYATVAILGLASRYQLGRAAGAVPRLRQRLRHRRRARALRRRVRRRQGAVGRHACGTRSTRSIRPVGGALIAVATLGDASPDGRRAGRAARRHAGRRHALHQGRHARRRQHQPRAVLELVSQPRRRRVRRRPRPLALKYPIAAAWSSSSASSLMLCSRLDRPGRAAAVEQGVDAATLSALRIARQRPTATSLPKLISNVKVVSPS